MSDAIPRTVQDVLLELMRDERPHDARRLEELLPGGEWVRGVRELIRRGRYFERDGNSLRMRYRAAGELSQSVVSVVGGLDYRSEEVERGEVAEEEGESFVEEALPPAADESPVPEGDRVVLSEPAGDLVLSAAEYSTSVAAILARRKAGKTYLSQVIAEGLLAARVPFAAVDPMGVYYGLGARQDGSPSDRPVLVLGGRSGHHPLLPSDGDGAARLVSALSAGPEAVSTVLDLSAMLPREQHGFVADYGERIFARAERSPLHLMFDECDEFSPQRSSGSSPRQKDSLEVVDRLVRRGRTRALGITMISQRPAVLNKNVLSQVDTMFWMTMVEPRDVGTADDWISRVDRVPERHRRRCVASLAGLGTGEAYYLRNGDDAQLRRFRVRAKVTYDSSRTPRAGEKLPEPSLAEVPAWAMEVAREMLGGQPAEEVDS